MLGCNNGIFHCYACYNAMLQAFQTPQFELRVYYAIEIQNKLTNQQGFEVYFVCRIGVATKTLQLVSMEDFRELWVTPSGQSFQNH